VSDYLVPALVQLASNAPALLFWIAVIVFGAVRRGQSGERAESFLIAGGAVGVLATLLKIPMAWLPLWLINGGSGTDAAQSMASGIGIAVGIVNAIGIVLLIYAFWLKFHSWKNGATGTIELERGPHDAFPG
jgi:hypothetical protein